MDMVIDWILILGVNTMDYRAKLLCLLGLHVDMGDVIAGQYSSIRTENGVITKSYKLIRYGHLYFLKQIIISVYHCTSTIIIINELVILG